MERAYITGATGTVGMALVDLLLKNNIKVTIFIRKSSDRFNQLKLFQEYINEGTLTIEQLGLEEIADFTENYQVDFGKNHNSESEKNDVLKGKNVFYHLGWSGTFGDTRNNTGLQERNAQYTLDAVKLAKKLGCDTFIGAGSQAEYGRVNGKLTPYTKTQPENEYGRCKLSAGIRSAVLCRELGMRYIWARILSVYGPYDGKRTMIMSLIDSLSKGDEVSLTQGIQTWDYLFCEDAARALYMLGESKAEGIYCLGSGQEMPLKDYIIQTAKCLGADEGLLKFGLVPYGERQVMRLCADITKLTEDTGFIPQFSFEQGIKKTIEWYKNNA